MQSQKKFFLSVDLLKCTVISLNVEFVFIEQGKFYFIMRQIIRTERQISKLSLFRH